MLGLRGQGHLLAGEFSPKAGRRPTTRLAARTAAPAAGPGSLLPEPLETVGERWTTAALVSHSSNEKRERLRVSGDPQRSDVQRVETHIADQPGGDFLGALVVPAIHQCGSLGPAPGLEDVEEHFTRDGAEGGDDTG